MMKYIFYKWKHEYERKKDSRPRDKNLNVRLSSWNIFKDERRKEKNIKTQLTVALQIAQIYKLITYMYYYVKFMSYGFKGSRNPCVFVNGLTFVLWDL